MTEFLHGYDKQAQAKEVTLHFQMYAREHVFSLFSTGMKATMSTVFLPSSMCRMLASEHVFSLFSDSMKDTLSTSPFPEKRVVLERAKVVVLERAKVVVFERGNSAPSYIYIYSTAF